MVNDFVQCGAIYLKMLIMTELATYCTSLADKVLYELHSKWVKLLVTLLRYIKGAFERLPT